MKVWIAYREDGAVHQDQTILGVYDNEWAAKRAAQEEAIAAYEEGAVVYSGLPEDYELDPEREDEDEADWDVCTGVHGPYEVES
jgi:hypothetical protein